MDFSTLDLEIGRILHLKSETRDLKLDSSSVTTGPGSGGTLRRAASVHVYRKSRTTKYSELPIDPPIRVPVYPFRH